MQPAVIAMLAGQMWRVVDFSTATFFIALPRWTKIASPVMEAGQEMSS